MRFTFIDKKQKLMTELLAIFLLPVLLFQTGALPLSYRFVVLIAASICVVGIMVRERYTLRDIGLRTDNIFQSLPYYLLFIVLAIGTLFWYAAALELPRQYYLVTTSYFIATFIPVSILQEVVFRGFLTKALKDVYSDEVTIVLINAALFTAMHAFYPLPLLMLPLAFISGIAFSAIYMYRENLYLVSIAHAFLNFFAIYLGFFVA